MPSFPTLTSGEICSYPLTRTRRFRTGVVQFVDGSEQRYAMGNGSLEEFELQAVGVSTTDKNTVRDFYLARGGPLDSGWDLTLEGTTRHNCTFVEASFLAEQQGYNRWNVSVRVRQTR